MPGKGVQASVEPHLPRHGVVLLDQRAGIVEQHLGGHSAKGQEGALHPLEPVGLPLPQGWANVHPPREAERRDEQMGAQLRVTDPYPRLAEVDLQLSPRRRLEPHRRACLRLQLPPPARNPPLDMPQADHHTVFGGKLLADDIGIAGVAEEPLAQPRV